MNEEKKIEMAKNVFAKFKSKINILLKKQNDVFKRIMKRINKRKLEEERKKLNDLYKKNEDK